MKTKLLKYLRDLLKHVEYYNKMAPFPVFDTEYVEEIKKSIIKMEKNEYDEMPVVACKHCHSLHIINDELENDHCMRCSAINEIVIYDNIEEYFEKTGVHERT